MIMKLHIKLTNVPNCVIMLLICCCCLRVTRSNTTCSNLSASFERIRCYSQFPASQLDLFSLKTKSLYKCFEDCAQNLECKSVLRDSRSGICSFYRPKINGSISGHTFLHYHEEDNCDSAPESECYRVINGSAVYSGRKMTTESGITCQRIDQQTPHRHINTNPDQYPETTLAEVENFCRDPDGEGFPWCYTMNPDIRYRSCGVPRCKD